MCFLNTGNRLHHYYISSPIWRILSLKRPGLAKFSHRVHGIGWDWEGGAGKAGCSLFGAGLPPLPLPRPPVSRRRATCLAVRRGSPDPAAVRRGGCESPPGSVAPAIHDCQATPRSARGLGGEAMITVRPSGRGDRPFRRRATALPWPRLGSVPGNVCRFAGTHFSREGEGSRGMGCLSSSLVFDHDPR